MTKFDNLSPVFPIIMNHLPLSPTTLAKRGVSKRFKEELNAAKVKQKVKTKLNKENLEYDKRLFEWTVEFEPYKAQTMYTKLARKYHPNLYPYGYSNSLPNKVLYRRALRGFSQSSNMGKIYNIYKPMLRGDPPTRRILNSAALNAKPKRVSTGYQQANAHNSTHTGPNGGVFEMRVSKNGKIYKTTNKFRK